MIPLGPANVDVLHRVGDLDLSLPLKSLIRTLSLYQRSNKTAWPSQVLLAKQESCSVRTIQRRLKELDDLGYIKVLGTTIRRSYLVIIDAITGATKKCTSAMATQVSSIPDTGVANTRQGSRPNYPRKETKKHTQRVSKKATPSQAPTKGQAPTEDLRVAPKLMTKAFITVWHRYRDYRRGLGLRLCRPKAQALLDALVEYGPAKAAKLLRDAMANGWETTVISQYGSKSKPEPYVPELPTYRAGDQR